MEELKKLYDCGEEENVWFIVFNLTEGYLHIVRTV